MNAYKIDWKHAHHHEKNMIIVDKDSSLTNDDMLLFQKND